MESTMKPTNPKDKVGTFKPPQCFTPQTVVAELGVAMMEGGLKYGPYNWRESGVLASIYYDAARRHLDYWWEGEDIDPDSGLSHITKAIASLTVLRDAMIQDRFVDNRPPESLPYKKEMEERVSELMKRYGGKLNESA